MTSFLDTSMIIRYLTGDPPELARQAASVIDSQEILMVTDVVLAETAYVLTSVYQVARTAVVDHLIAFIQKENIAIYHLDKGHVLQGLLLCRPSVRVAFGDAMIWAAARSAGDGIVYSLDERFPEDGLEVLRKRA